MPLCTSGYRSNQQNVSLFTALTVPSRLEEWERMIRRSDRRLTPTAVVGEKHFEEGCIERSFKVTVNGVVNEIAREKPRLKTDAVPTVFENYPKHIVPKKAPKRKIRNICQQGPAPKRHRGNTKAQDREVDDNAGADRETDPPYDSFDTKGGEARSESQAAPQSPNLRESCESLHPFDGILIPATWMKVPTPSGDALAYAFCEAEAHNFANLFIERMVSFAKALPEWGSVAATVYLRRREESTQVLASRYEAEVLVKKIAMLPLRCGCGMKPVSGKYSTYRNMYFVERCLLSTKIEGESCIHCKYSRILAQNQACRMKKRNEVVRSEKMKRKNITRTLTRTRKRLASAQAQVAQMKEQNKTTSEGALEKKKNRNTSSKAAACSEELLSCCTAKVA